MPRTYQEIVARYIHDYRADARAEIRYHARQPSLKRAVEVAALAVARDGKRHPHQRRIPRRVLEGAKRRLMHLKLRRYTSFHELHNGIANRLGSLSGIGPLTVYDIATRIGAYLKLRPEYIYLHAGTRDGARVLGLANREFVAQASLPPAFGRLSPAEIEDCLCIYRDYLVDPAA